MAIILQWISAIVLPGMLTACAQSVWAAGGVYQIGVVRTDGTRTTGSAVQLSPGRLLASCHTVRQAREIVVLHANRPFKASLVRGDAHHDLCLLGTARFGGGVPVRVPSSRLRVGNEVSAYGFAPGFRMSIARGQITALHPFDDARVIRTSARFPRGASGGALFDDNGHLIGLLAFRAQDAALNYALPMEWVEELLEQGSDAVTAPEEAAFWELPAGAQAEFLRAAQMEHEGDWEALGMLGRQWTARDPDDAQAWRALGRAQLASGRVIDARDSFEHAVEREPACADAWYWLAQAAHRGGDDGARLRALDRLRVLDPDLAGHVDRDAEATNR